MIVLNDDDRPMSEAPTDGREILLRVGRTYTAGRFVRPRPGARPGWWYFGSLAYRGDGDPEPEPEPLFELHPSGWRPMDDLLDPSCRQGASP